MGAIMGLDVKLPIGLLFTIFGVLLVIYGFTSDPSIYSKSMGVNINLRWGILMLVFGLVMFFFSKKSLDSDR
jgi:hypothetical protein